MRGRVPLHGCIKVALSYAVTMCLKSLVSRGTKTVICEFLNLFSFYMYSLHTFPADFLRFNIDMLVSYILNAENTKRCG